MYAKLSNRQTVIIILPPPSHFRILVVHCLIVAFTVFHLRSAWRSRSSVVVLWVIGASAPCGVTREAGRRRYNAGETLLRW